MWQIDGKPFKFCGSTIKVPNGTAQIGSFFPLQWSVHNSYVFFCFLFLLVVGRFVVVVGLNLTFVMDPLGATIRIFRLGKNGALGGPG